MEERAANPKVGDISDDDVLIYYDVLRYGPGWALHCIDGRCCVNWCRALPVWLAMAALHAGLGLALKLYFFHYSSTA